MSVALFTIAFNRPKLIAEQIRLVAKHLQDEHAHCIVDNSTSVAASEEIRRLCESTGSGYVRVPGMRRGHDDALSFAFQHALGERLDTFGFLDHDVFPSKPTSLLPLIEQAGFYGIGQRHAPTGHLYLWPGFCFFTQRWLAGRSVDFDGIRGNVPADDGDAGSMMWPLFSDDDWERLPRPLHGYREIRPRDDNRLQSWGMEVIGDWWHLTNGSHWMRVPDPDGRDRVLLEMLAAL